jgi:general secretion pathway protein J
LCVTSSSKHHENRADPARLKARSGFTLLEVLIAVVLLGILTTALYASYFTVFKARERAAEGMEARRELGATLDLLRREIASSQYVTSSVPLNQANSQDRLRFVVEDRDYFGKPASILEFTTLAPPADGTPRNESGILAVRYEILENKNKQRILTRKVRDVFHDLAPVKANPQMERISGFLVECYDGSKWLKTWNTELNRRVPPLVRITVQFEEDGKPVEFSVLVSPKVIP